MKRRTVSRPSRAISTVHTPADDVTASEFAALLKQLRMRAGLSQQILAERALVSVQAVSALERGYRKAPYRKTLDRIADALRLPPDSRAHLEAAARRARESRVADRNGAHANNLPRRLTSFVGRDDVVDEIAELVCSEPLVSVVGTGGAGKTRAAIEVGSHVLAKFPDGVWFVELAPLGDPGLLEHALASALAVTESPRRSLILTLSAYLQHKRVLLLFDNCEHLIAQARAAIGTLLRECPHVNVLVTSREPLSLAGERVYRMPPLDIPGAAVSADEALQYGAVALFADRARAADARFRVSPANLAAVVEICRRLDGLPLALELAAARTTVLSPAQIAERLDRRFDLLGLDEGTGIARHQTMRAAIDWSYDLLSSSAQVLFDRSAVFAGGFSLEGATAVCADAALPEGDVLEVLTALVTRSLAMVEFSSGEARYHLLESTRHYALERLARRGEREVLAGRHARAFLELALRSDADWYGADERAWFREAEAELDNCRAALHWTLSERRDVASGCGLAAALARVWYSLSPVEGRRWVRTALEAIGGDTGPLTARLHVAEAELCGALGEYAASLGAARRALDGNALDDELQTVRAQLAAGSALGALGELTDAETLLQSTLATARALDNRRLTALALGELGTARSRGGDVPAARLLYAEALATYTALGLERPAASIAGHLAEVEFAAGDATAALALAEEARGGHENTRNRRSAANDVSNMAAYSIALNRFEDARIQALEALAAARDVQSTVLTAYVLQHVAAAAALRSPDRHTDGSRRERAAMLLGFVNARLQALQAGREYTERQEYERMTEALRGALGEEKLAELLDLGAGWTEEGAAAVAGEL